jgi:hypothetical protein
LSFIIDNFDDILEKRFNECNEYTSEIVDLLSNNIELTKILLKKMNILLDEYANFKVKSVSFNIREYTKIKNHFIDKDVNVYLLSNIQGYVHNSKTGKTMNLVFGLEYENNAILLSINKIAKGSPLMSSFIKMVGYKEK